FTGLAPLWATRMAGGVLLGACALLVVMINAAWQNGAAQASVAPLVRVSARVAALLLAPVTAIAIYALGLRVAEYGWTNERIIAAAGLLVAACYALGYARAALRSGWLAGLAGVNVGTAFVVLALLLALFSPLADPARLSVNHQLARLAAGKVAAAKFDYRYLRFEGARFGRAALARLAAGAAGADAVAVRQGAQQALSDARPWVRGGGEAKLSPADLALNLAVWPSGTRLPQSFLDSQWGNPTALPACLWKGGSTCDAYLVDLAGDGKPQVMLIGTGRGGGAVVMGQDGRGGWRPVQRLPYQFAGCAAVRQNLVAGHFRAVAAVGKVLEIAGKQVAMSPIEEPERDACK
ncbi:MAG: DUF4153 domain-containing protein, partial [Pseudomonadota bacterium]|nr:DUF4153 domain-containing protein [Pseudomonadota bacterium]